MESHRQRHRMKGATRHSQAGITALGFLILAMLVGVVGFAVLKVTPMYIKNMRMNTILEDVKKDLDGQAPTVGGGVIKELPDFRRGGDHPDRVEAQAAQEGQVRQDGGDGGLRFLQARADESIDVIEDGCLGSCLRWLGRRLTKERLAERAVIVLPISRNRPADFAPASALAKTGSDE